MQLVVTLIASALVFGLVIFIHELGHFVAAKKSGVKVNEFALGMGPTIFSVTRGETKYALRLLPIGGFVAMEGEDSESDDERSFNKAKKWQRAIILVAGGFMNLILGFAVLTGVVLSQEYITSRTISTFDEGASTKASGLMEEDTITAITGRRVYIANAIVYELARTQANTADFTVQRGGETVEVPGVTFDTMVYEDGYEQFVMDFVVYPIEKTPITVIQEATGWTISLARLIFLSLIDLVTGRVAINNLSGPVGIVTVIGDAVSIGLGPLAMVLALLTVNLGVFNLLPLPALDGGRLLFLAIEAIIRRPVPQKFEIAVNGGSFVLLMALMLFVTYNDITRLTRAVKAGGVTIGGGANISVQSMLSVRADDIAGNVAQAQKLQSVGCDIIRIAVPDEAAVETLRAVKGAVGCPIVADIHFDYRLALLSVAAGVDKIRINPGNIGGVDNVKRVVEACGSRGIPIRIGVNGGSLDKEFAEKFAQDKAEAMVQSALLHIKLLEDEGFYDTVISLKCSDVPLMLAAYRRMSAVVDYPLHLGVTEAGTLMQSLCKSAMGIGALLMEGIGDTLRVSITGDVCDEVTAGFHILRSAGKVVPGIQLISCPTCGRTQIPLFEIAQEVEKRLQHIKKPLKVAVMGCVVNGPGEAKDADIGIAGGKDKAVLFKNGDVVRTLSGDITTEFVKEVEELAGE